MGRFGLNSFSQAKARPSIGEELASDQTRSDLKFISYKEDIMRQLMIMFVVAAGLASPSLASPCKDAKGKFMKCPPVAAAPRSALSNRQRCLREMRHAGSEAGVRPLPTLGSPISDKQLWQCARQQLSQHGEHALVAAAERMAELEEAGDREGYAT